MDQDTINAKAKSDNVKDAIRRTAEALCAYLPDYEYDAEHSSLSGISLKHKADNYKNHNDNRGIYITIGDLRKRTYALEWPFGEGCTRYVPEGYGSIGISTAKGPEQIAKEITRRLLNVPYKNSQEEGLGAMGGDAANYDEAHAQAIAKRNEALYEKKKHFELRRNVLTSLGQKVPKDEDDRMQLVVYKHGISMVSITSSRSVSIETMCLKPHEAEAVIEFMKTLITED